MSVDKTQTKNIQEKIAEVLIAKGQALLSQPYKRVEFTGNKEADDLLNNLSLLPHAFTIACVMDRQIKAERAWLVPYQFSKELNDFSISTLIKLDLPTIKSIFKKRNLHRFNDMMAKNFFLGIQKIHSDYNDDASNIWKGAPRSATIVKRFLSFDGVGVKIATMATNILARDCKIPMKDHICIDISPDRHVKRVFGRLGFISSNASNDELLYCARELNPNYPGIFDLACWEIGRYWCKPQNPVCNGCLLSKLCPKILT